MMFRTHLAFAALSALVFLSYSSNKLLFLFVALASALLPDVDSAHSILGKRWFFRPMQWMVKHRGVFHSLTFCLIVSLAFAFFYPVFALPFFLGYASHLLLDSFTDNGIRPFWPSKKELKGFIRTGGKIEKGLLYGFILTDILLIIRFAI